jgi:peptidoglycan hydrolase-like protein with peptidoglycan-binding domain
MYKVFFVALFITVSFVFPAPAHAVINPGTCTIIDRTLTLGASGTDVTQLQRFLVAQNYPGGGSWMVTGYFGSATRTAVQNFQMSAGLAQTGVLDQATRNAIQQYSCGGTGFYSPSYTGGGIVLGASTASPYTPYLSSPSYCAYYNCGTQSITLAQLSPNAGGSGTSVTAYGTGFSETNNTVHFGNAIIPFLRSTDGRTLVFEIPTSLSGFGTQPLMNQSYPVYVTNAFGQNSNQVNFTVTGSSGVANRPWFSTISGPSSLARNENGNWSVTVYGPQSSIAKVDVIWGDEYQGTTAGTTQQSIFLGNDGYGRLSFSHSYQVNSTYSPTFIVSNGYGSSVETRSVIVGGGSSTGTVSLNSLSPNSGQQGTQVILYGSGFTPFDNTIRFGFGGLRNVASVANGTALYFTVPHYISTCDTVVGSCSHTPTAVTPGSYPISVTNANGTTQSLNFIVTQ